jgi:hypothetical protein
MTQNLGAWYKSDRTGARDESGEMMSGMDEE